MPELPEVEFYRQLAMMACHRTVVSLATPDPWFLKEGTTTATLCHVLIGHQFVGARRHGKVLLLDTDTDETIGMRFGMTGTLVVDGQAALDKLIYAPKRSDSAWDRLTLCFEDGGSFVVHDPRRLGGVMLNPDMSKLGPDAASITVPQLAEALAGTSVPLKGRLLDQSRVAGIGNLVADESLWRAGLSPIRPASSLDTSEITELKKHLEQTLIDLQERGGSHYGDLMDERRHGGRCPKDGTEMNRSEIGGRTTWWCSFHQV